VPTHCARQNLVKQFFRDLLNEVLTAGAPACFGLLISMVTLASYSSVLPSKPTERGRSDPPVGTAAILSEKEAREHLKDTRRIRKVNDGNRRKHISMHDRTHAWAKRGQDNSRCCVWSGFGSLVLAHTRRAPCSTHAIVFFEIDTSTLTDLPRKTQDPVPVPYAEPIEQTGGTLVSLFVTATFKHREAGRAGSKDKKKDTTTDEGSQHPSVKMPVRSGVV
jgi:hypothetical protein